MFIEEDLWFVGVPNHSCIIMVSYYLGIYLYALCNITSEFNLKIQVNLVGVSRDCVNMYRFLAKNPAFTSSETTAFENATRISVAASMEQSSNRGYNRGRGRFNNNRCNRGGRGYGNSSGSHYENKGTSDRFASAVDQQATKL